MKIFAVMYFVMIFLLMVSWPLVGSILPDRVPGDVLYIIGSFKIHAQFGTSLIITGVIMIFLWMLGKL